MNQEIKKQWVEALRSGEFEQGKDALCRHGKFCCLGVLSELGHRAGVVKKGELPDSHGDIGYGIHHEALALPLEVVKWSELGDRNPKIPGFRHLASLNDSGRSFDQLANLIEWFL